MKRLILLAAIVLAAGKAASAQTPTLVDFDSPACSGGVDTYGGIDFSASPWNCELAGLTGDATTSISWNQQATSGTFRFASPATLISLRAGSSSGVGTLTVSTDAGETFSVPLDSGAMGGPYLTGFTKPAIEITVSFPGGWTLELDDLLYATASTPTMFNLEVKVFLCTVCEGGDDVAFNGSATIAQTNGPTVTFPVQNGLVIIPSSWDLGQPDPLEFTFTLSDSTGTALGSVQQKIYKVLLQMVTRKITGLVRIDATKFMLRGVQEAFGQ
jgi:hypothetical protein